MEKLKRIPKQWLISGCVTFFILIGGFFLFQRSTMDEIEPESLWFSQQTEAVEEAFGETSDPEFENNLVMYVDIKGSVHRPGIYQVQEGDRLYDVIQQAGGLREGADEQRVNLASKVMDQQMIYIPEIGEEIPGQLTEMAMPQQSSEEGKVNINTADVNELRSLSGIGEKRAQDIIAYREEHGSFQTVEELQEVSGIGEKTVENLKSSVTIK